MMKVRRRFIIVLFLTLVLFTVRSGGRFLVQRADIAIPSIFHPPYAARLLMSMEGFRLSQFQEGSVPWRMESRYADLYENKEARLRDIEIVYKGSNARTVTTTGDEGTMNTENGNATLLKESRDVRMASSDGYLMTTPSLTWESKERRVKTTDAFKLLGSNLYLEGKGFSADADLHTVSVHSHVKAVLQE